MALNDMFEIVISGSHSGGQGFSMTSFYKCVALGDEPGTAEDIGDVFDSAIIPLMQDLMVSAWSLDTMFIKNLNNPSDYLEETLTLAGELAGNGVAPVLAVGIRSPRQDIGVNRGRHQLPFGERTWFLPDGSIDPTARDSMFTLVQNLGIQLGFGGSSQWVPFVIEKQYTEGVFTGYVERGDLLGQWTVNTWFTTQKTRQSYSWEVPEEPA